MITKVMVAIHERDVMGTTYEVEGEVAVGDTVTAEYGNGFRARTIRGKVLAVGSQPRVFPDGHTEPPYLGPCKRAVVVGRAGVPE